MKHDKLATVMLFILFHGEHFVISRKVYETEDEHNARYWVFLSNAARWNLLNLQEQGKIQLRRDNERGAIRIKRDRERELESVNHQ